VPHVGDEALDGPIALNAGFLRTSRYWRMALIGQRILHRSALIDYVPAAERRGGETLTMGDALAELLADITEAARTIGTLLQAATARR
jgi:hypothetical protein